MRCRTCPTGKRVYLTRTAAERTLMEIWSRVKPGRTLEARAYKCPTCLGWHLTKQGVKREVAR